MMYLGEVQNGLLYNSTRDKSPFRVNMETTICHGVFWNPPYFRLTFLYQALVTKSRRTWQPCPRPLIRAVYTHGARNVVSNVRNDVAGIMT